MTPGSVLVSFGDTQVLCTVSLEPDIPRWLKGQGKGWVTAEYNMLPGSSPERVRRSLTNGRSQEIQRLIGRSLRSVCDLRAMGERSIIVDCDVLQADGGTRTASICGAYLALHDVCTRLTVAGELIGNPLVDELAAISVGLLSGEARLDLPYAEDSVAEVDFNVVMTGSGRFVEVQGTAESAPFSRAQLDELVDLAASGIARIVEAQRAYLAAPLAPAAVPTLTLRLVCGSANPDKVAEMQELLAAAGVLLDPRPPSLADVEETAETLLGNARLKGLAVARAAAAPAVAEDTGLEVEALGGAPGVRTARFAGEHGSTADNVAKLLADLAAAGAQEPAARRARFRTVAVVCWPDGREVLAEGAVEGTIALEPRGEGGFGYDPVFVPLEGDGRTFAEMSVADKHALSHRGRALRALAALLDDT